MLYYNTMFEQISDQNSTDERLNDVCINMLAIIMLESEVLPLSAATALERRRCLPEQLKQRINDTGLLQPEVNTLRDELDAVWFEFTELQTVSEEKQTQTE